MRLDPDLGFAVPKLDSLNDIPRIQEAVSAHSKLQDHARIKEIAHRLIASTFFFEKVENTSGEKEAGTWECDGKFPSQRLPQTNVPGSICCRFSTGSEEMRALGRYIHAHTTSDFEPFFTVQEDCSYSNVHRYTISEEVLRGMCVRGRFKMPTIHVTISREMSTTTIYLCLQATPYVRGNANLPISGFPRSLMIETIRQSEHPLQEYWIVLIK
jgi:hypothetical protein